MQYQVSNKDLPIPYHKLLEYESILEKAKDKKELNRRNRGISSDNFFKYKDFLGKEGDNVISVSPNKHRPDLKAVYTQKVAGFGSELTYKKSESPFEWKMNSKTPERPFRDRFKFGNNKVSGKITVPTQENAFLAMKNYFSKKNKHQSSLVQFPENMIDNEPDEDTPRQKTYRFISQKPN